MRRPFLLALFALLGLALDLGSKWLVFARLGKGQVCELVPDVLHLTAAENRGVAFSLLRDRPVLILCFSVAALAVIAWLCVAHWRTAPAWAMLALGLLLVGAAGNLVDRALYGHVRDFIDFVPRLPLVGHWPVFNLADACITLGVALYLLGECFGRRRTDKAAPQPARLARDKQ